MDQGPTILLKLFGRELGGGQEVRYVSPFGRERRSFRLYSPLVKQLQICLMLDLITQREHREWREEMSQEKRAYTLLSRDCPFYVSLASFHPEGLAGLAVGIMRFSGFV